MKNYEKLILATYLSLLLLSTGMGSKNWPFLQTQHASSRIYQECRSKLIPDSRLSPIFSQRAQVGGQLGLLWEWKVYEPFLGR